MVRIPFGECVSLVDFSVEYGRYVGLSCLFSSWWDRGRVLSAVQMCGCPKLEFYRLWFLPPYCQFWNVCIRSFAGFSGRKSSIVAVERLCCRSFDFSKGGGAVVHCCAESVGHNLV